MIAAEVLLNTEGSYSLYEAVAEGDYKSIVLLYSDIGRKAVLCNSRLGCSGSKTNNNKIEEKLDEYFCKIRQPPYNLMVMDELDSIMEEASMATRDKTTSWFATNPSRRKSPKSFQEEEEENMRCAAKILSNARAPPTFIFNMKEFEQPLFDGSAAGSGGTLLHLACIVDRPFALVILLALGGDPKSRHSAFRRLPVHEACCCESVNCLALLMELSDYTPKKNPISFTQMLRHILTLSKEGELTELEKARAFLKLVDLPASTVSSLRNCSPTSLASDGHGNTPLHWAAFKDSVKCVSILLKHNADPNCKAQPSGWTPLHDASYSDAAGTITLLLEAGAYVDACASSGATPLCFAAQEDAPNAVKMLLEAGANTQVRCCGTSSAQSPSRFSGYTPLHYCAHYNASRAAKLLLSYGSSMKIQDLNSKLPIHVAVSRASTHVLQELLCFGAKIPNIELKASLPKEPIQSSKPWNCVTQSRLDRCNKLLLSAEKGWNPLNHFLFSPNDRKCIIQFLLVGKHFELCGSSIFVECWTLILNFCPRGWFDPNESYDSLLLLSTEDDSRSRS